MYKSYAFTLRPRNGVAENSPIEQKAIKLVEKYNGFLVAEKEQECRHLHGQLFFPAGKRKYDLAKVLIKVQFGAFTPDPAETRVLKQGIKIAYSDDFYTDYTNKPDSIMLTDKFIENSQDFYPSEDEQEKVRNRARAVDAKYHHLKELWDEDPQEFNQRNITLFLYRLMYVDKKINVISDKKCFNQTAKSMFNYIGADMKYADDYCFDVKPSVITSDPPFETQEAFEAKLRAKHPSLFT